LSPAETIFNKNSDIASEANVRSLADALVHDLFMNSLLANKASRQNLSNVNASLCCSGHAWAKYYN